MDTRDMRPGNADAYHELRNSNCATSEKVYEAGTGGSARVHPFARPCASCRVHAAGKDPGPGRVTPSQLGPARPGCGESDTNEETKRHSLPQHTPHVAVWDVSARSTAAVLDCPRRKRLSASEFSLSLLLIFFNDFFFQTTTTAAV